MLIKNVLITTLVCSAIFGCMQSRATKPVAPDELSGRAYLHFPTELRAETPHDVDRRLQRELTRKGKFNEVQRLFDVLAWQNFVSLNWPASADGEARARITDEGKPRWTSWKESYEVYKPDGGTPLPWGESEFPENFKLSDAGVGKVLFRTGKFSHLNVRKKNNANVDDEIDQAFTSPIWDQNGNILRYEVLMNKSEFDYVVSNKLYNLDGQIVFAENGGKVAFPSASRDKVGAIELKLAWKIIDKKNDIRSRFLRQYAWVMNEDGTYSRAEVGMVGMHIALKTDSSPQWIWATFEHVDNLEANSLERFDGKPVKPLFYDPNCPICPINVYPELSGDYSEGKIKRNQIQRVLPIAQETQDLNARVQALLAGNGSVLQHYQLIGTQWPTEPSAKPYPVSQHSSTNPPALPEAITNKSGGKPTPTYLTNMIMETYFQGATEVGAGNAKYNTAIANTSAWHQIQGNKQYGANNTRIFGTESCMGCHYSSSITVGEKVGSNGEKQAIAGEPGSADFSWLLGLKAQFKQ